EHTPGLERELIGRDRIRIAIAAGDQAQTLVDLRERRWVMEPIGTASREWATQQCRAAGFEPDVQFEAADLIAHVGLIASGHAVGFLPAPARIGAPELLRLVDLPDAPYREIFAAMRAASSTRSGPRVVVASLRAAFVDAAGQAPANAGRLNDA